MYVDYGDIEYSIALHVTQHTCTIAAGSSRGSVILALDEEMDVMYISR